MLKGKQHIYISENILFVITSPALQVFFFDNKFVFCLDIACQMLCNHFWKDVLLTYSDFIDNMKKHQIYR